MILRGLFAIAILTMSTVSVAHGDAQTEHFVSVGEDSVWVGGFESPSASEQAPALLLVPGFPALATDVLGLGERLSELGTSVFVMHPRGHGNSSGWSTYSNAIEDVGAVLAWLQGEIDLTNRVSGKIVLGGYSWGGGIVLAYTAEHPEVDRVVTVAPSNHGVFIRRVDEDPKYGDAFRSALQSLQAPAGPVRFDVEADFTELRSDWPRHDLATIAPDLANRDLLVIVGWDDQQVELEHQILPFYRALRKAEATRLQILGYQEGHRFLSVRSEIAVAIHDWLAGTGEFR